MKDLHIAKLLEDTVSLLDRPTVERVVSDEEKEAWDELLFAMQSLGTGLPDLGRRDRGPGPEVARAMSCARDFCLRAPPIRPPPPIEGFARSQKKGFAFQLGLLTLRDQDNEFLQSGEFEHILTFVPFRKYNLSETLTLSSFTNEGTVLSIVRDLMKDGVVIPKQGAAFAPNDILDMSKNIIVLQAFLKDIVNTDETAQKQKKAAINQIAVIVIDRIVSALENKPPDDTLNTHISDIVDAELKELKIVGADNPVSADKIMNNDIMKNEGAMVNLTKKVVVEATKKLRKLQETVPNMIYSAQELTSAFMKLRDVFLRDEESRKRLHEFGFFVQQQDFQFVRDVKRDNPTCKSEDNEDTSEFGRECEDTCKPVKTHVGSDAAPPKGVNLSLLQQCKKLARLREKDKLVKKTAERVQRVIKMKPPMGTRTQVMQRFTERMEQEMQSLLTQSLDGLIPTRSDVAPTRRRSKDVSSAIEKPKVPPPPPPPPPRLVLTTAPAPAPSPEQSEAKLEVIENKNVAPDANTFFEKLQNLLSFQKLPTTEQYPVILLALLLLWSTLVKYFYPEVPEEPSMLSQVLQLLAGGAALSAVPFLQYVSNIINSDGAQIDAQGDDLDVVLPGESDDFLADAPASTSTPLASTGLRRSERSRNRPKRLIEE